ncbi:uncharacterized protein LOC113658481 isoform X2 [Tachysurus fulvidraco]|uniref:uncharacterized protein LOC113658481 isoform X2 n=1 Tax=Tachysurus fulvidraco TaxID=1234273 RepID=UPI001FEEF8C0|nr:uncharacterized protein LOC113658481 isoform X2 [Tachysurus fulvidraco]
MDSLDRCSHFLPPGGGPTPPTAPSTNSERTKGQENDMWIFISEDGCVTYTNTPEKITLDLFTKHFNNEPLYNKKNKSNEPFLKIMGKTNLPIKKLKKNKHIQKLFSIIITEINNDLITETNEEESMNYEIELIGPFGRKRKKHSEDLLIKKLKERKNIYAVWIYTTNSPCLGRKSHFPCLYNLINYAKNHNIKMYIGFSKYYIFSKDMYKFIKNLEELRNWNPYHKFQVQFNITEFKFKAARNIIKNIISEYSSLEMTYSEWHQTGSETSVEFESTLRKELMESSDEEFNNITEEFKIWWTLSVDENLNRHVLPSVFEHIQGLYPNLEFFQVDLEQILNLANEE